MTILNITICQSHDFCDYTVMLSKPCQVLILYFFLFLVDSNNNSRIVRFIWLLFAMTILNITICQSHDFCDYTVMLSKPCQVLILYFFLFLVDSNNNSRIVRFIWLLFAMTILNITICQSHDFCDYTVMLSKPCQVLIWYFFLLLVDSNNNSRIVRFIWLCLRWRY